MAFFYKSTTPDTWGLRDGQWKFFVEKIGSKNPKLFNLNEDPTEQKNIISSHPEKTAVYAELIANWYIQANQEYVKNLEGYKHVAKQGLALNDVNTYGPKRIAVGTKPRKLKFMPLDLIHLEESLTIWTHGTSYPEDTDIYHEYTSPSGKVYGRTHDYRAEWTTVYVRDKPDTPREEGTWKLVLFKDNKEILRTTFEVSSEAKLYWSSIDKTPGIRQIHFGFKKRDQSFQKLKEIHPTEKVAAYTLAIRSKKHKRYVYEWISPSGKKRIKKFKMKKKWRSAWVYHRQKEPMEEGLWTVNVLYKDVVVISGQFIVSAKAPVYVPMKF